MAASDARPLTLIPLCGPSHTVPGWSVWPREDDRSDGVSLGGYTVTGAVASSWSDEMASDFILRSEEGQLLRPADAQQPNTGACKEGHEQAWR